VHESKRRILRRRGIVKSVGNLVTDTVSALSCNVALSFPSGGSPFRLKADRFDIAAAM
jgi:hypothetical protein